MAQELVVVVVIVVVVVQEVKHSRAKQHSHAAMVKGVEGMVEGRVAQMVGVLKHVQVGDNLTCLPFWV